MPASFLQVESLKAKSRLPPLLPSLPSLPRQAGPYVQGRQERQCDQSIHRIRTARPSAAPAALNILLLECDEGRPQRDQRLMGYVRCVTAS